MNTADLKHFAIKMAGKRRNESMTRETGGGGDRERPSPPGPINSISWVGPGGTQYTTKMVPFYFSSTVFQQLQ